MTQKERLVELLEEYYDMMCNQTADVELADYLLSNGVIVPPCKVGDTVYILQFDTGGNEYILEEQVQTVFVDRQLNIELGIGFSEEWFPDSNYYVSAERIGKTERVKNGKIQILVFQTRKEAEQALKERDSKWQN